MAKYLVDGRDPIEKTPENGQEVLIVTADETLVVKYKKLGGLLASRWEDTQGFNHKPIEWAPLPTHKNYRALESVTIKFRTTEQEFEFVIVPKE